MIVTAIVVVGAIYGAVWGLVLRHAYADQRRNNQIAFRNVQSKATR